MIVLFYLGALIALLIDSNSFSDPKFTQKYESEEDLNISAEDRIEDPVEALRKVLPGCFMAILQIIYWMWNVGGFFTFQWPFFLVLFILGLISKKTIWLIKLDAILSIVLVIFIVLNQAHFKIHLF